MDRFSWDIFRLRMCGCEGDVEEREEGEEGDGEGVHGEMDVGGGTDGWV